MVILQAALEPAHFHCTNILRMQETVQKKVGTVFFVGFFSFVCLFCFKRVGET